MTTMQRMEPQHAQIKPPPGAIPVFVTSDGRQIYRMETQRARAVPRLDEHEKRMWRKNQNTGEPMYPLNRPEVYDHTELFSLESEGNWNVRKIPYIPPTAEQLAEQEREQKVAAMQEALPRLLVDEGFGVDELLAALRQGRRASEPEAEVEAAGSSDSVSLDEVVEAAKTEAAAGATVEAPAKTPPAKPETTFPKSQGKGMWVLSDGRRVKKTREQAFAMEAELRAHAAQAAKDAAAVPEH